MVNGKSQTAERVEGRERGGDREGRREGPKGESERNPNSRHAEVSSPLTFPVPPAGLSPAPALDASVSLGDSMRPGQQHVGRSHISGTGRTQDILAAVLL